MLCAAVVKPLCLSSGRRKVKTEDGTESDSFNPFSCKNSFLKDQLSARHNHRRAAYAHALNTPTPACDFDTDAARSMYKISLFDNKLGCPADLFQVKRAVMDQISAERPGGPARRGVFGDAYVWRKQSGMRAVVAALQGLARKDIP